MNRYHAWNVWIWGLIVAFSASLSAKTAADKAIYRIGFIHPRSGPLAIFGNSLAQGVKLGLQQFRMENPQIGERFSLISADDRGLASEGEKAALRLIQKQKVQILIGSLSNTVNQSIAAAISQSETALLLPRGHDEDILNHPNVFTMSLTDRRQGQLIALFAQKNLRRDRAAIVTDHYAPDAEMISNGFQSTFAQDGGQIVGQFDWGAPKFNSEDFFLKLSAAEANIVIFPGLYRTVGTMLNKVQHAGIKTTFIGSDGWDHDDLFKAGPKDLGNHYFFSYFHINDPQAGVQNFVSEYEGTFGQKPDALAALGYDTIRVALQALLLSKTGTNAQLINALEAARFPGIYGAGHFAKDRVYLRPYPFLMTKGGKAHFMTRLLLEQ